MSEFFNYYRSTEIIKEVSECDHVVSWSGGIDSSLLLYGLIQAYGKTSSVGAFAIDHTFLDSNKRIGENNTRKKFIEKYFTSDKKLVFNTLSMRHGDNVERGFTSAVQLVSWITNMYPYVKNGATMYFGVLADDSQVAYITEINNLITTLNNLYDKKVKVKFPFITIDKDTVLAKSFEEGISNVSWVCEAPKESDGIIKQCAVDCISCREHILPLINLNKLNIISEKSLEDHFKEADFIMTYKEAIENKNLYTPRMDVKDFPTDWKLVF